MPPAAAIAIPAALGVAGMVSQNAQNKSAAANNANQQASAVANAQDASKRAQALVNGWIGQNPTPVGATPVTSSPSSYGAPPSTMTAANPMIAQILAGLSKPGASTAPMAAA